MVAGAKIHRTQAYPIPSEPGRNIVRPTITSKGVRARDAERTHPWKHA